MKTGHDVRQRFKRKYITRFHLAFFDDWQYFSNNVFFSWASYNNYSLLAHVFKRDSYRKFSSHSGHVPSISLDSLYRELNKFKMRFHPFK